MLLIYTIFTYGLFINYVLCVNNIFAKFSQRDYKIKDVRMELIGYNDKYMNHASVITYKYNRSTPAINASINFKLDNMQNKMQTLVQGYKFASNEYRDFPIHFQSKFCDGIEDNAMGFKEILKCGNLTECNFRKDTLYYFCNFVVDESKLPPLIPTGIFKLEIHVTYFNEFVFGYSFFLEVYRPIEVPHSQIGHKYF